MDDSNPGDIYAQLADALDRLPSGFPRAPSNVEIPLLRKIFSPPQAAVARHVGREPEPVDVIAGRAGLSEDQMGARLMSMGERRLIWFDGRGDKQRYRLAPFVIGIYEVQLHNMDHELAHLFEHYMADGIMKPQPAIHRVVSAQRAVKSEWVLPYDDVRKILSNAKTFRVSDCICRKQQEQIGRKCDFPLRMSLVYHSAQVPPTPDMVYRDEALAIVDEAEQSWPGPFDLQHPNKVAVSRRYRLHLQLLRLLLRHPSWNHRVGHRELRRPGELLRGHRRRAMHRMWILGAVMSGRRRLARQRDLYCGQVATHRLRPVCHRLPEGRHNAPPKARFRDHHSASGHGGLGAARPAKCKVTASRHSDGLLHPS